MPLSCASFWQGVHFPVQNAFNTIALLNVTQRAFLRWPAVAFNTWSFTGSSERTRFVLSITSMLKVCLVHRALWVAGAHDLLQCFDYASFQFTLHWLPAHKHNISISQLCCPQLILSLCRWYLQLLLRHRVEYLTEACCECS